MATTEAETSRPSKTTTVRYHRVLVERWLADIWKLQVLVGPPASREQTCGLVEGPARRPVPRWVRSCHVGANVLVAVATLLANS
jgi:hypothetical protein